MVWRGVAAGWVVSVVAGCGVVWCAVAPYLFSAVVVASLFSLCLSLCSRCVHCAGAGVSFFVSFFVSLCVRTVLSLSHASLTPLLLTSMTIKNGI